MFWNGSATILFLLLLPSIGEEAKVRPPEPEKKQQDLQAAINENCELVKQIMNTTYGVRLQFDPVSVQWIDHFILKESANISAKEAGPLVAYLGLFLGEAIRDRCGGTWQDTDGEPKLVLGENEVLSPVQRVARQFKGGQAQSLFVYYLEIIKEHGQKTAGDAAAKAEGSADAPPAEPKSEKQN